MEFNRMISRCNCWGNASSSVAFRYPLDYFNCVRKCSNRWLRMWTKQRKKMLFCIYRPIARLLHCRNKVMCYHCWHCARSVLAMFACATRTEESRKNEWYSNWRSSLHFRSIGCGAVHCAISWWLRKNRWSVVMWTSARTRMSRRGNRTTKFGL